jgi:glycosyltransferase involved in cell wall biosynthesis
MTSPGVGGREIIAPVLARQLAQQGHPTWLMCRPGTLAERLGREWGLTVQATRLSGYCDPPNILRLARFLRQNRIQVIHSHWSKDLSNLILASGLAGSIPIVLTKHVYATNNKHDPFHAWIGRHTDRFIGVSQLVSANIVQTLRVSPAKVVTIYNGVDLETEWNPEKQAAGDLRPEWGIPKGQSILGFAGRINRGKGPHVILEAFACLASRFPEWHFVLAGKAVGEQEEIYQQALQKRVAELGLTRRVHFLGYRPDMPAVMRMFDIFVCASEFESLGMVAVEAMAMERPAVGPDSGGIPEIIVPGETGELFRPGDGADLTEKLSRLMADPVLRQSMGLAGRRLVLRKFSLDRMAEEVAGVFREVTS